MICVLVVLSPDENRQAFRLYPLMSRDMPTEKASLQGFQAVSTVKKLRTFRRTVVLQTFSDGLLYPRDEGGSILRNVGNSLSTQREI
jgi:hypothetical protein